MKKFKIEVKPWMMQKSSEGFDFMLKFNNDIPMPLKIMYGYKIDETKGMVKLVLNGDLREKITQRCMMCGKVINNPISQFFGLGPICGGHNYTNPFDNEEDLKTAVDAFRTKLVNTKWTGWVAKSAILSVYDEVTDEFIRPEDMPMEVDPSKVDEPKMSEQAAKVNAEFAKKQKLITARVDKPTRGSEDYSVYLSFPYNAAWVAAVKNLPIRFWNNDTKEWEILYSELADLQDTLSDATFEVIGADQVKTSETKIPSSFTYKTKPFSHQVAGIQYGMKHDRWLLCDQQGLGKTLQIIDLAAIRKITDGFKHCLIICGVNGLKWNWEEEIATHSNEKSYILGQKFFIRGRNKGKKYVGTMQDRLNDALNLNKIEEYFIITNVETLRNTKIAEALGKACEAGIIGLVAIDEFHMCRNAFTQQSEGIMKLQPRYRIGMTGTPLMNTPLDFYSIFNWLGYEPYGYRAFRNHFCIFDEWNAVVGYKNTEDLTKVLDKIMLRRTKEEVLDLPEKTYINEYIELNEEQMRQYNQAFALACQQLEKDDAEYNPLAEIIRLRQATGCFGPFESITANPKLDRVEQLVQEALNQNDKVVIFSQWTEMTDLIVKRLNKYGVVSITGDTKDSDRQEIVNKFQTDPSIKVFVGSMKAVGVGITLTAASTVIFTDEPWTHGAFEQCVDRCHRIGTSKKVTVHTILAHNTIDEKVHDIMMMKANLSAKLVDGQMTYTRNDVIKYLFAA
jgi:SNF2 family DNA or RNA helicase